MGRIRPLSDVEKKKIAAGEVVEGPFSVLKELIENSLDAGAGEIDVTVEESGLKRIQVRDNGSGIYREDLELAIAEHATSKINNIYDIDTIASFGFRGEALSSISSISEITVLSRRADEELGGRLFGREGDIEVRDFAGPSGTTVIVENLFYNTPARKKFLKARRTEMRYLREIFLKLALANHAVSFSMEVDGKRYITLVKTGTLEERIRQIYPRDTADSLYFDRLKDIKVEACGFFSKPDFLKSSRIMQMLFVNRRPVEYRYFGFILSRAYEAVAPRGQYPAGIVFIDIKPELVDVNVHPTKKEVKFFDQKYIDSLILQLAGKVLNRAHEISGNRFRAVHSPQADIEPSGETEHRLPFENTRQNINPSTNEAETGISSLIVKELPDSYRDAGRESGYRIIGIAFDTYIIVEKGSALFFIDFHAAHERIIYDSILEKGERPEVQELLFPRVIELSLDDFHLVMENRPAFTELGFMIDEFSDRSITVRSAPEMAKNIDGETFIREFLENVKGESGEFSIAKRIAASAACHAAKRAGDRLSGDEISILIEESMDETRDRRCPHGRPYVFTIEKSGLEKIFKRE